MGTRERGLFSHVRECSLSSHKCEGVCRLRAAGAKGPFSFAKENGPFGTPRERLLIGSLGLERLLRLRNESACARRCRVSVAIRLASASIIRCRSADLVEVQTNHRLPPASSMRRAKQCRYFARSLPPFYRHSRLTIVRRGCKTVTNRRGSWRSHVHRTRLRSACSHSSARLPM